MLITVHVKVSKNLASQRPARAGVLRPGGGWNSIVGFVPTHQTQALCTGTSSCQILKQGNHPFRAFMRGMMLQVCLCFLGGGDFLLLLCFDIKFPLSLSY